ncbi:EscS/YscS/HrcS family type III secretion system export apparatus protein [Citrobacter sp. wls826]|uniref:EscS/YscS/HrcS family type III secretion system export apparatus protein n=1 Tax=Citrobacter sp. wls826 TaxID=2576415 RepID=UPI0010C9632F|nr:EscS/YscS/HrcS family type III secretion system export apparatus protein [Citrobacter sp. wls826]TKU24780.1 EscS/YscS/HrcS family type III secretion system export apparatus protein [Citrobacter sp. wls826]TKV30105.1 EscS/YscS/HrcS family type III secretion system export apparatus protein [Citrobacter sp. TBCS-11]
MNELIYAGDKTIYMVLVLSAVPIIVATIIGLIVGLIQTVTQLQEQTLPFGIKLICVSLTLFLMSNWYGEMLIDFSCEVYRLCLNW